MKRSLLFYLLVFSAELFAQKACFIYGSYIAAVYSEHDQKIKFINTYTNQVFSYFNYKGAVPELWFTGSQLVLTNTREILVTNIQTNKTQQYPLKGKAIPGSLYQLIEQNDSILIMQIENQTKLATINLTQPATVIAAAISTNEKILCIVWEDIEQQFISCFMIQQTPALLWQLNFPIKSPMNMVLNPSGTTMALWNGKSTSIISVATGEPEQQLPEMMKCIRFTPKEELICVNSQNRTATLFNKMKNGKYKSTTSVWFKDASYLAVDKREEYIE